jgi:hypothetical protein
MPTQEMVNGLMIIRKIEYLLSNSFSLFDFLFSLSSNEKI